MTTSPILSVPWLSALGRPAGSVRECLASAALRAISLRATGESARARAFPPWLCGVSSISWGTPLLAAEEVSSCLLHQQAESYRVPGLCLLDHRFAAAFLAISARRFFESVAALALPPRLPSSAAALLVAGDRSSSSSPVAIRMTLTALPITSAGRFSPRGPLGMLNPLGAVDLSLQARHQRLQECFGFFHRRRDPSGENLTLGSEYD